MANHKELLLEGLKELNLSLSDPQISQLLQYEKEINFFNDAYGLV
ncbi:MAG: 16S rRNA (guanine(527)-N(7))-methyltransferase RsmG, partial [Spirochaetia bacterium]|nr:16S rRNA (guanine(527)-N(7))-methyltransferase RsmG [Spirochaetia bacterium]